MNYLPSSLQALLDDREHWRQRAIRSESKLASIERVIAEDDHPFWQWWKTVYAIIQILREDTRHD